MKVYLDNAATTPIAREVVKEIEPYLYDYFGNPSSTHSFGRKTKNAIEINRKKIADLIHAKNNEIISELGTTFSGDEPVSMNYWGFMPQLFEYLLNSFKNFLDLNGQELKSEFLIPSVINELIEEGKEKVQVLETESSWFGVTFKEDKSLVVSNINELIKKGIYPHKLF